jgi:hypothetical protein
MGRYVRLAEFVITVVALPAALGYFLSNSVVIAILAGVIVLIIVLGYLYFRRQEEQRHQELRRQEELRHQEQNRPPYTVNEVDMDLRFHDPRGDDVTAVNTQRITVNQRELSQIRLLNMSADGPIENIRVDDKPIDQHPYARKMVESGILSVIKDFNPPLMRGQKGSAKITVDVIDAFHMNPAGFNHRIGLETEKVRLEVHFDSGRVCHNARAFLRSGGVITENLPEPDVSDNGMELVHEASNPEPGLEYRVEWRWDEYKP